MGDMKMDLVMVSSEKPKVSSKELIEMTAELEETSLSAVNGGKMVPNCPQSIVLVQELEPLCVSAPVLPVAGQGVIFSPLETIEVLEQGFSEGTRCVEGLTAAACDGVLHVEDAIIVKQLDDALGFPCENLNAEGLLHNEMNGIRAASPHFLADLKERERFELESQKLPQTDGVVEPSASPSSLLKQSSRDAKRAVQRQRIRQMMSLEIGVAQRWICANELTRAVSSKVLRRFWLSRLANRHKCSGSEKKLLQWIGAVEQGTKARRSRTAGVMLQCIHDAVLAREASLPTGSPAMKTDASGPNLFPSGPEGPQQQIMVATIQLAHCETKQWVTFEGCRPGNLDTISVNTAHALGLQDCKLGDKVRLSLRAAGVSPAEHVDTALFEVVQPSVPAVTWSKLAVWTSWTLLLVN